MDMQATPPRGQTLVYSTVDGHNIKFDYFLPRTASGRLPAVIYYHGGGMTAGWRGGFNFPTWLHGMFAAIDIPVLRSIR
jgi:cephalosporin-C deacetylase-like acetyl esterase